MLYGMFYQGANVKPQGRRCSICSRKGYREEKTQQHLVSKCANVKNSQSQLARAWDRMSRQKLPKKEKKRKNEPGFVSKERTIVL